MGLDATENHILEYILAAFFTTPVTKVSTVAKTVFTPKN